MALKKSLINPWSIGVLVLVLGGAGWFFFHPRSVETDYEAGTHMIDCTLNDDGGCLLQYASKSEIEALKLNESNLRDFVHKVLHPRLTKYQRAAMVPRYEKNSVYSSVEQDLQASDRNAYVGFYIVDTADGPKAYNLMSRLLDMAITTERTAGKIYHEGPEKAAFEAETVDMLLPTLKQTGIDGLIVGLPPAESHFTWEEFRDQRREMAKQQ